MVSTPATSQAHHAAVAAFPPIVPQPCSSLSYPLYYHHSHAATCHSTAMSLLVVLPSCHMLCLQCTTVCVAMVLCGGVLLPASPQCHHQVAAGHATCAAACVATVVLSGSWVPYSGVQLPILLQCRCQAAGCHVCQVSYPQIKV